MNSPYSEWNPRQYLEQYYSPGPIPGDSQAMYRFVVEELSGLKFSRAIDVGCGPSAYMQFVTSPHYDELSVVDLITDNLDELRMWVDQDERAFNWEHYATYALVVQGKEPSPENIRELSDITRRKVREFIQVDLLGLKKARHRQTWGLVMSWFAIECISSDLEVWRCALETLVSMVSPGGTVLLASLSGSQGYSVFNRRFPVAAVNEKLIREEFLGNTPGRAFSIRTMTVPVQDWKETGFESIVLVRATRQTG